MGRLAWLHTLVAALVTLALVCHLVADCGNLALEHPVVARGAQDGQFKQLSPGLPLVANQGRLTQHMSTFWAHGTKPSLNQTL